MAGPAASPEVIKAIADYLRAKHFYPTPAWLASFMASTRPNTPMPALQQTALFRLLSSDLTSSVQRTPPISIFPPDISNPEIKERKLTGPVAVQVLDVEDIGRSRWSQVEAIEAQERGEMTKGREIIRVVADESTTDGEPGAQANTSTGASGPFMFLLQDAAGTKAFAFDMSPMANVNMQKLSIGAKLVLRDLLVARGVVLLAPNGVEVLGGKVEAWDTKWKAERKAALKGKADLGGEDG
ncbi:hypothetical protein BDY17DRAFT_326149 [Neohortaea acidophila]|uniref:RecQ-mediated genome instability protein 1 n=1 Tax=Neohortaea acidophila TaxID=245834 RepID=A0A6A6PP43_9PEZI|nr:uncharacterized protein BDY17DRAFT_326149 [Neohortaea acidophila]KAF2481461.1 hypothetical protein BDY17DRAFT_326149 [Neohortaea acidophila]